MYVISSKGIPADVNGGDDVATRKYKSTCGKGGGSFCCSVSALCVYVLFTVVCPIYIENISWQLARNKSLTRSVSDCVPLPARVSSRVVTLNLCVACMGAEHASLSSHVYANTPLPESAL